MNANEDKQEKVETNPVKVIRLKCLECCGGDRKMIELCNSKCCPLVPFRFGFNPYRKKKEMTEEQRQAAAERLAKARENKKK